jgi:hypothetical protein
VDFAGDIEAWADHLMDTARDTGLKWTRYHVGQVATGVELGAGKSESRTRVYDAALKHPGEFSGPTGRLEHEWKPGQKPRKELAYLMDPGDVLGTSRPARRAVQALAGISLGRAPARTERVSDLDKWLTWMHEVHAGRMDELLSRCDGDLLAFAREMLAL